MCACVCLVDECGWDYGCVFIFANVSVFVCVHSYVIQGFSLSYLSPLLYWRRESQSDPLDLRGHFIFDCISGIGYEYQLNRYVCVRVCVCVKNEGEEESEVGKGKNESENV